MDPNHKDFAPWLIRAFARPPQLPANVVCVALNDCGKPGCDGKCRAVAIDIRTNAAILTSCFDPGPARELAFKILAVADQIDPAGAMERKRG